MTRRDAPPGQVRRIVFVASTAGLQGFAYVSAYCAAKHGVIGLMRALAAELARIGATVNAVCPGYTETPMLESSLDAIVAATGRSRAAVRDELAASNPGGRLVTPEEVAAIVRQLCTPAAAATTGQAIRRSGGRRVNVRIARARPGSRAPRTDVEAAAAAVAAAAAKHAGDGRRAARAAARPLPHHAATVRRAGGAGARATRA